MQTGRANHMVESDREVCPQISQIKSFVVSHLRNLRTIQILSSFSVSLCLCGFFVFCPLASAQTFDERFLDGLRQRRLFPLAEKFCHDRLAQSGLTDTQRVDLAIELSRTLTDHALNSAPRDRESLWQRALAALDEFAKRQPPGPRVVLAQVQSGLVQLARGEQLRQEAEVIGGDAVHLDEARQHLRAAIALLQTAAQDVTEQLRKQHLGQGAAPGGLTTAELGPLQKNVNFQLARALRSQAECYPAGSPDRANSLEQAVALLAPLAQLDSGEPLAWPSRLDEIVCYRLLGDAATAERRLTQLDEQKPPARIALGARAERVRLALARGESEEALKLLDAGLALDGVTSSELDYAALEACVVASRQAQEANRAEEAAKWRAKGAELVALIDERHGPFWSRRAETLLAGSVAAAPGSAALGELVKAAESFYRAGRDAEALAAYDRAWKQAVDDKQPQSGFDAAFTAAAIEQSRENHPSAATRFHQLALAVPAHTRASEAHLLAIFNTAQTLKTTASEAVQAYRNLLAEHLDKWPASQTANQARLWLARLDEREQKWAEAIALYAAVPSDHPQQAEAAAAMGRCYLAWLAALRGAGEPTAERAAAAAKHFEGLITGGAGALPSLWTEAHRTAALDAARVWLDFTNNAARAEAILTAALNGASDAPPEWKRQAQSLMACALAAQGRRDDAAKLIEQLAGGDARQLLTLVEGLNRIASAAAAESRRDLASLTLQAAAPLREPAANRALSADERRRVSLLVAQSLTAAGQAQEARQAFSKLAAAYPKDAAVQEQYAETLLAATDAASLHEALERWRTLEQGSRPASERWFRAKLALATVHQRLGNKERALQIIKLTQVLHPDLGGPELKARFLALLAAPQK